MRNSRLLAGCSAALLLVAFCNQSTAQEDFAKIVEVAIKEEIAAFDDINSRFEKGKLKPGFLGQPDRIRVEQMIGKKSFLGTYQPIGVERSRPFLFQNIPTADEFVDKQQVTIAVPLIVVGRNTYDTVAGGTNTTWVIEPLYVALNRARDAEAKKKKK